jgi:hypothetical protein
MWHAEGISEVHTKFLLENVNGKRQGKGPTGRQRLRREENTNVDLI